MALSAVETSSVDAGFGRHGMPPPVCNPDLWPFDLGTGVRVASEVGNLHPNFGTLTLGLWFSNYSQCTRRMDRRTDKRTDKSNAYWPLPYGRGIITWC